MPTLSVVIITFNEELNILRCLQSVEGVADEIIVVDSGSTDHTIDICKSRNVKVMYQEFLGYIEQKNFAMDQASSEWVLSLDADEALSPKLKSSIQQALANPSASGYLMNRLTNFCGHWVKHSGWYPDRKLRLYQNGKGTWGGVNPHDHFDLFEGKPASLQGDLLHYSYNTISDHIKQIDRFSTIGAKAMYEKGMSSSIAKIIYKPIARFLKNYIVWSGFRDGLTGFIIAKNSAHAVFLKYLRLYYLQKGKTI